MNPDQPNDYNPADDDNQGVVQLLVQAEEANNGVSQVEPMNPVNNQGPEPIKEEVSEHTDELLDAEANHINDDVLAEEEVENGSIDVENE